MRTIPFGVVVLTILALLASAAAFSPTAAAERNETAPEDGENAWVEDCPPDMMCAFGGAEDAEEGEAPRQPDDCKECMRPPDCEYCRGGEEPQEGENAWVEDCPPDMVCAYNDPDRPVDNSSDTCMDGTDEGEDCRDDVQYMVPDDGREPATDDGREIDAVNAPAGDDDASAQEAAGDDASQRTVPALAMLLSVGVLGTLAVAIGRQR